MNVPGEETCCAEYLGIDLDFSLCGDVGWVGNDGTGIDTKTYIKE